MGSDAEVGWQWARQLSARDFDVTVITRRTHQAEIESEIAKSNDCRNVNFVYVDIEWLYPVLAMVNPRNHIYYYFWQMKAMLIAKAVNTKQKFDLVHHVTWVSFRQPSLMGLLGVPMYFGPVAGGDEIPKGYEKYFSAKRKVIEHIRSLVNAFVLVDPFMRLTYRSAERVFFTSIAHLEKVPSFVKSKAEIELAIGIDIQSLEINAPTPMRKGNKLLFVGRFLGLKGMDIGLRAFALILKGRPDVTLTMIGDGEEKHRWQKLAIELGVNHAIEWLGWLPKTEVFNLYASYDVFYFPSLRDSGGFVVLEALNQGMPVVCFKLGGPGEIVNDTCGKAIIAHENLDNVIEEYANATLQLLDSGKTLSSACQSRVVEFTWDKLIGRIYGRNVGKPLVRQ